MLISTMVLKVNQMVKFNEFDDVIILKTMKT